MQQNRFPKFHLALTILLMVFIFCQSALPADLSQQESGAVVRLLAGFLHADESLISFCVRKGAHFLEYLLLGASLFYTVRDLRQAAALSNGGQEKGSGCANAGMPTDGGLFSFLLPWIFAVLYAASDELHQYFVPGRSCELRDVLIDACGAAAGVAVAWLAVRRSAKG